jgi:hypothetical protein
MKNYLNCQRLFAWQRIQGLSAVGRRSALEIGTSVHLGLSVYHGGGIKVEDLLPPEPTAPAPDSSLHAQRVYEQELIEFEETKDELIEAAKLPLLEQALFVARKKLTERAGPTSAFQDKDLAEALDIVERVLPAYFEYWKDQGEIWHPLNQEIEACVEVGDDTNVFLRFKADNLSSAKGGLYLVDYKTAGRMDPRDLLKYELDIQLSAYIYGLTKQLTNESLARGGEPVYIRGAIIDVLVKTQTPQFAREMYSRTVEELAEFEAEWIEYSNRIREQEDRVAAGENWKIVFPKNTNSCFQYGTCAFRDVCLKDSATRRQLYDHREPDYVDNAQRQLHDEWLAAEKAAAENAE